MYLTAAVRNKSRPPLVFPCFIQYRSIGCQKPGIFIEIAREVSRLLNFAVQFQFPDGGEKSLRVTSVSLIVMQNL